MSDEVFSELTPIADLAQVAFKDVEAGLIIINGDNKVVMWNQWISRASGVDAEAVLGRGLDEIFPDLLDSRVLRAIEQALKDGLPTLLSHTLNRCPFPLYRSFHRTDGELMRQIVVVKPTKLPNIERHCLVQVSDITSAVVREEMLRQQAADLKKAQADLVAAQEESSRRAVQLQKEATEMQMAGGFAHEMRNALSGANLLLMGALGKTGEEEKLGLCEENRGSIRDIFLAVEAEAEISAKGRALIVNRLREMNRREKGLAQVLQNVHYGTTRALGITKQIMEYSKLGHSQRGENVVGLRSLVQSIFDESIVDFKAEGIVGSMDISPDMIVEAEELHIYSIIKNLVVNARDALVESHDPGERRIEVIASATSQIEWELRVRDNGHGIPDDAREKIFSAFFSTKPETGTGLGLGMVEKLASLYDGDIDFESEVGAGTTFILRFGCKPSTSEDGDEGGGRESAEDLGDSGDSHPDAGSGLGGLGEASP